MIKLVSVYGRRQRLTHLGNIYGDIRGERFKQGSSASTGMSKYNFTLLGFF